ncbi:hypothetical protein [Orenia metallireducens]|jgi:hypothetical protein|uniref:hypothetical protein n=1 Tax=Orenia metallireducens TaxID=1413210 RepID=UPI00159F2B0C|nr:hypothetical protein [Orenia metallireducens]
MEQRELHPNYKQRYLEKKKILNARLAQAQEQEDLQRVEELKRLIEIVDKKLAIA